MAWAKVGDNAATYPPLMKVAYLGEDDRSLNEVAGFLFRAAFQSAGHTTDYIIGYGTAQMIGGVNYRQLIETSERAGLLVPWESDDGEPAWKLIEDPQFIHLRLKEEIEWEKQQANDSKNVKLTSAVRHRDGDACRYCSNVVYFSARSGGRRGTYDHRGPTGEPGTIETLVVACGSCNSGRKDYEDRDTRYPLLPPPPKPYYSKSTAAWLAKYGYTVKASEKLRPGKPRTDAPNAQQRTHQPAENPEALGTATDASTGRPSSPTAPPGDADRSQATDAHTDPEKPTADVLAEALADMPGKSGLSGTGRDRVGSGRDGTGRVASSQAGPPPPQRKPKRSSRGRPRTRRGK